MNEVKNLLPPKELSESNAMVNCYYILQEASDIILRAAERTYAKYNVGVRQEVKMRHNQFMRQAKIVHNINDKLMDDYVTAFGSNIKHIDELRRISSYMARIMMLIADRCSGTDTEHAMENKIYNFIKRLPETGSVSKECIESLRMR